MLMLGAETGARGDGAWEVEAAADGLPAFLAGLDTSDADETAADGRA